MTETDEVRSSSRTARPLDALDRKILAALVHDADRSYAALGAEVGLSAPAVHERVRRLRRDGRIKRQTVQIDPAAVGKPLLAFVMVDTEGWRKDQISELLGRYPEVEEIHSVAGDMCLILKVRCEGPAALEGLLKRLYAAPGVTTTKSYMVLSTVLERPVQAHTSDGLAPDTGGER